jgi:hypothetical protein
MQKVKERQRAKSKTADTAKMVGESDSENEDK